jgi:hypothetical protein
MSILQKLDEAQFIWKSSVGAANPGIGAEFRGLDMLAEFKDWNWLSTFYFSVSGKKLSVEAEQFLNGVYCMCFSYPDARIWNNGIASMSATTRSTAQLGVGAGNAVSEADFYGGRPVMKSVDFMLRARAKLVSGLPIQKILDEEKDDRKILHGYGRPIVARDERVTPAINLLKELHLLDRPHIQVALSIEECLEKNDSEFRLNICGVFAAFCADEGMTPQEVYYILVVCYSIGMLASYVDVLEKPEGHFFPFQCDAINYQGVENRKW